VLVAYGLYAPLNAAWLRSRGVHHIIEPEREGDLVELAASGAIHDARPRQNVRQSDVRPDRRGLLPLAQYAALQLPSGVRRVAGSTDATRGCKHLCRHCPIVPVYRGRFRAVPIDVVIDDVRAQVRAGAEHITFGDPDFLNGPTHARRLVERLHDEFPNLTYDATIKIEHLLKHAGMLPMLRETGCLFVTSAVESVDDAVLDKLRKGHTRADFVRAVALCREAGLALSPTFVPFTPWTTIEGYLDLLRTIDALELAEQVAPIQLAIRLLVTAESSLLELEDIRGAVEPFDAASLTWPWHHRDPAVDTLQRDVMSIVTAGASSSRGEVFAALLDRASAGACQPVASRSCRCGPGIPTITEAWYCCAEPMELQV
jgi:hypothetical protein